MKFVGKIVLTFVIPAVLLGYNLFEGSSMFKSFLGTSQTEKFLKTMLLTQYDEQPGPRILSREDHPDDFEAVWGLIRTNSSAKLRQTPPYLISRIVVENGAFVTLPGERRVILIPEATPLFALYCSYVPNCPTSESVLVGSVGDLRSWAQEKEKSVRWQIDIVVILLSLIGGLCMEVTESIGTLKRFWSRLAHLAQHAWGLVRTATQKE